MSAYKKDLDETKYVKSVILSEKNLIVILCTIKNI